MEKEICKHVTIRLEGDSFVFTARRSDGPVLMERVWIVLQDEDPINLEVWQEWAQGGLFEDLGILFPEKHPECED